MTAKSGDGELENLKEKESWGSWNIRRRAPIFFTKHGC